MGVKILPPRSVKKYQQRRKGHKTLKSKAIISILFSIFATKIEPGKHKFKM
jgi:hypothetical protein